MSTNYKLCISPDAEQIQQALFILETASDDKSIPILEYLRSVTSATELDLLIHSGLEQDDLKCQLHKLCLAGTLLRHPTLQGPKYCLHKAGFYRLFRLARQLQAKPEPVFSPAEM